MSSATRVGQIHPSHNLRCDNCGTSGTAAYRVALGEGVWNYCEPCESVMHDDNSDIALIRDMADLLTNLDMSDLLCLSDLHDETRKARIAREMDDAWTERGNSDI